MESVNDIHVLFVGNSLTYFHDMPQTLQQMLAETHPYIKIHQITLPGLSLTGHLSQIITSRSESEITTRDKLDGELTDTEKKLSQRKWDIIILQDKTVSILIPEVRQFKINQAISRFKALVNNSDCEFILFNTWPSQNTYPQQYCYQSKIIDDSIKKEKCCSPIIRNLEEELALINKSHQLVATKNKLTKSDNGTKFYEVRTKYPSINLYEDQYHPNKYGSFLNACVFYNMLTKSRVSQIKYNDGIEPNTAKILKQIAG